MGWKTEESKFHSRQGKKFSFPSSSSDGHGKVFTSSYAMDEGIKAGRA
jgi:hypothetical protein